MGCKAANIWQHGEGDAPSLTNKLYTLKAPPQKHKQQTLYGNICLGFYWACHSL